MLFVLFLVPKPHHIAYGKMARKDVKERSDYQGRGDMINIVWFDNSNDLTWICRKCPIRKGYTIKDTSIFHQRF